VAEWQTRWLQVPVSFGTWGFKSPFAHSVMSRVMGYAWLAPSITHSPAKWDGNTWASRLLGAARVVNWTNRQTNEQ
jgi:hypothetical protein